MLQAVLQHRRPRIGPETAFSHLQNIEHPVGFPEKYWPPVKQWAKYPISIIGLGLTLLSSLIRVRNHQQESQLSQDAPYSYLDIPDSLFRGHLAS